MATEEKPSSVKDPTSENPTSENTLSTDGSPDADTGSPPPVKDLNDVTSEESPSRTCLFCPTNNPHKKAWRDSALRLSASKKDDEVFSIIARDTFSNEADSDEDDPDFTLEHFSNTLDEENKDKEPGSMARPWMTQAELDSMDSSTKTLWIAFDTCDSNPKDGQLSFMEFKFCMERLVQTKLLQRKSLITDKIAMEAFKQVDIDDDGGVSFQEFQTGYEKLRYFLENDTAHKMQVTQNVVASVVPGVATALQVGEGARNNNIMGSPATQDQKPLLSDYYDNVKKEQVEEAVEESLCVCGGVLCALLCALAVLLVVWVGYILIMTIALWVGAFSGESCDQPLEWFCWVMGIIEAINIGVICAYAYVAIRAVQQGATDSMDVITSLVMPDTQSNKIGTTVLNGIRILELVFFILGCYWFSETGGLFGSAKGDCQKVASVLWTACYWYFMATFVEVCVLLGLLLCVCIAVCAGGSVVEQIMSRITSKFH